MCGPNGTKKGEYYRTIEHVQDIFKNQGLYYALAFLYDAQYSREDIGNMLELMEKKL